MNINTLIHKKDLRAGTTLLEVLLYISIASVMLGLLASFILLILQVRTKTQNINNIEIEGTKIVEIIKQKLRNAEDINSPSRGNTSSSLSIDTYNTSKNPTTINLVDDALVMSEGDGSEYYLSSSNVSVTSVNFKNSSGSSTPGTIQITLVLESSNSGTHDEFYYTQTLLVRPALDNRS